MTTNSKRLSSDYGFKSPGFSVDSNGNITGTSLGIKGVSIIDSTGALTSNVKITSIEVLGSLQNLDVNGNVNIRNGSVSRLSVNAGRVVIKSGTTGTIDNMNIGTITPGTVSTYNLSIVNNGSSPGNLNVSGADIVANNATISGNIIATGYILLANSPTAATHAVRKDYVDSSAITYAVAFGA